MGEEMPNRLIWMMHFPYWGTMISVANWLADAMWKQVIAVFLTEPCNLSMNQEQGERQVRQGNIHKETLAPDQIVGNVPAVGRQQGHTETQATDISSEVGGQLNISNCSSGECSAIYLT